MSLEMRTSTNSVEVALTEGEADKVAVEDRCSARSVGRAEAGPFLADLRLARSPALPLRKWMPWP